MLTLSPSGLFNKNKFDADEFSSYDPTFISRYLLLAGILELYRHHQGGEKLKVLEVGGAGSMLTKFVDVDLTIIDIQPNTDNLPNYIQGSALTMPLADDSFDAVISSDVLEHIPATDRNAFLQESARTSKDLVVIAAPFNLKGVRDAEISANDYYKRMAGRDHRWLLEHLLDELPDLMQVERKLEKLGLEVDHFSSTALDNWQLVTRAGFLLSQEVRRPEFADLLCRINKHYLETTMKHDFSTNGYRTFIIASKQHEITIKPELDKYDEKHAHVFSLLTDTILSLL